MKPFTSFVTIIAASIACIPVPAKQAQPIETGRSTENMVASVHPLATQAGLEAFENGGNAIDAAVATALMLGVVDGFNSGIGGGCFVLIRTPDGQLVAIDGREMAPAAAERDMYLRDGKGETDLSQTGALAIGVPGALAAYHDAVTSFGKLKFADVILPAAEVAESGFPITAAYQRKLQSVARDLASFPGAAEVLLKPDGEIYETGEVLIQEDLAHTYREIAKNGPSWFYNGPFATQLENWMTENGGVLTARDMANYRTVRRKPIRTRYRDYEIVGFPPPSSGGVHVAQILNILQSFDLAKMNAENPAGMKHVVAEAMKLAFADRAYWLGDPDYVNVPLGLIDEGVRAAIGQTNSNPAGHPGCFPRRAARREFEILRKTHNPYRRRRFIGKLDRDYFHREHDFRIQSDRAGTWCGHEQPDG